MIADRTDFVKKMNRLLILGHMDPEERDEAKVEDGRPCPPPLHPRLLMSD